MKLLIEPSSVNTFAVQYDIKGGYDRLMCIIVLRSNFQMNDNELEAFVKIADENGEISKNDIIIQVNICIF